MGDTEKNISGNALPLAAEPDLWDGKNHDQTPVENEASTPEMNVDVEGFEGPLGLLLDLSRRQKVDLAKVSILALAEQYLEFIEELRELRIELAADYLVMAAWLAFLKSKLLLPNEEADGDEMSGEEMAALLAFRLQKLEAMREAGNKLINRSRLGQDFFARGNPEAIEVDRRNEYKASLYDLLTSYASQRQRQSVSVVRIEKRDVWSLGEARAILIRLVGELSDWTPLDLFLLKYIPNPEMRVSAIASSFAASLELVREGTLAIKQDEAFAPIFLKSVTSTQNNTHSGGRTV